MIRPDPDAVLIAAISLGASPSLAARLAAAIIVAQIVAEKAVPIHAHDRPEGLREDSRP